MRALKAGSGPLLKSGRVPPEAKVFIKAAVSFLEVLVALLLEKRTRRNSGNSGLPPSQDPGGAGNRNKKGKGTGTGEGGAPPDAPAGARVVRTEETLPPPECRGCGAGLDGAGVVGTDRRKIIDVVHEVRETVLVAETRECPGCGERTKAEFPRGVDGKEQYGNGVRAAVVDFATAQMMSLKRIQGHFEGILGRSVSQAAMLRWIARLGDSLGGWEKAAVEALRSGGVLYADETSMRVLKRNFWIWTYGFRDVVLHFIDPSRGLSAVMAAGVLPGYTGVVVHDFWSVYFKVPGVGHALCLAHLLRELKFVEESVGHRWATNLKELLKDAVARVNKRKARRLGDEEYARFRKNYRSALTRALRELPDFPERASARRTDAQNLWLRFRKYEREVLTFARVPEVDATNNRAERDLRMNKVKRKVSGCFRSEEMARHFCRISGYLKTMRNKGYSSFEAISMALEGDIPAPSLGCE